jgi:hypothetical protein
MFSFSEAGAGVVCALDASCPKRRADFRDRRRIERAAEDLGQRPLLFRESARKNLAILPEVDDPDFAIDNET